MILRRSRGNCRGRALQGIERFGKFMVIGLEREGGLERGGSRASGKCVTDAPGHDGADCGESCGSTGSAAYAFLSCAG